MNRCPFNFLIFVIHKLQVSEGLKLLLFLNLSWEQRGLMLLVILWKVNDGCVTPLSKSLGIVLRDVVVELLGLVMIVKHPFDHMLSEIYWRREHLESSVSVVSDLGRLEDVCVLGDHLMREVKVVPSLIVIHDIRHVWIYSIFNHWGHIREFMLDSRRNRIFVRRVLSCSISSVIYRWVRLVVFVYGLLFGYAFNFVSIDTSQSARVPDRIVSFLWFYARWKHHVLCGQIVSLITNSFFRFLHW